MLLPRISLILSLQIAVALGFSWEACNTTRSCWFHPPECSQNNMQACMSGVEWEVVDDGIQIQLQAYVHDLDQTRPFYLAVGFSHNQRMNDDTVVECIQPLMGEGKTQLSFNDETSNHVLPQASSVLVSDGSTSVVDGLLTCKMKFLIDNVGQVNEADRFKIHDLTAKSYFLLFARGNADIWTLEKDIHSVNDGPQFPWMSNNEVSFCRGGNCTDSPFVLLNDSMQSWMERYWRYRVAVLHGVALLLAWWVLGSNGILIARYFKPLFPRRKLLGTAVWFQLHRSMMILSVVLQILAVIFIFYQAGWVWYECSYECTNDDFAKKMHAICGVFATCLAITQPFFAFLRPAPDARGRKFFNWFHWFVGMTAWSFASATILMSLPLGKIGLQRVYGHVPNYVMGGYVIVFVVCNVLLELISSSAAQRVEKLDPNVHRFVVGPSGMALSMFNGPSTESPIAPPKRSSLRLLIFFTHLLISLGVAICITVMLVTILLEHSP